MEYTFCVSVCGGSTVGFHACLDPGQVCHPGELGVLIDVMHRLCFALDRLLMR